MKRLIIITALISFSHISTTVFAQADPRATGAAINSGTQLIDNNVFKIETTTSIKGTPYYFDEWLKGEVLLIEGIKSNKLDIKIDTYRNQIHFLSGENILALDQKYVKEIYLEKEGETMTLRNGFKSTGKLDENAFIHVLYDGDVKLYAHPRTFLREARGKSRSSGQLFHEFRRDMDYYLHLPDNSLEEIKIMRRKYILDILDDHKGELKDYAKEHDLYFDNKEDLPKILAHYDSLITDV